MQLRWVLREQNIPCLYEILEYANTTNVHVDVAMRLLTVNHKVLQTWVPDELWNTPERGVWVDVPIVEEMVDE